MIAVILAYLLIGLLLAIATGMHAFWTDELTPELLIALPIGCVVFWPISLAIATWDLSIRR